MYKILPLAALLTLTLCLVSNSLLARPQVFKCSNNGTVTYQSDPCPSGEIRKPPTVEQLNAERQKKLSQTPAKSANPSIGSAGGDAHSAPAGSAGAKCDGRTHCSQMSSCAEAKYFLTHCPGVEMDGDHNGIPCEKQWCRGLKH